jgi:hypothetical protein
MQETEALALLAREAAPVAQGFLEDREGADDVGLDELAGAVDRAVDMAFGRKVHHRIRLIFLEQLAQAGAIADALLLERVMRVAHGARQRVEIGRVGQLVNVHHPRMGVAKQMPHHGRADEARTAGDEDRGTLEAHACPRND